MNVLVLGREGLVGRALAEPLLKVFKNIRGLDLRDGGDVRDPAGLERAVAAERETLHGGRFDWIVNLAAMTAVDACESDPGAAMSANADGARNAALVAVREEARLLQVSSDYVFDGTQRTPYVESDETHPLSAYGRSKWRGEEMVRAVLPPDRLLLVRGQSLYGAAPKSFPDAILRAAREGKPIPVVTDQVVSPTWARDFAHGLVDLMWRNAFDLYHLSASGSCTWFEFARFVLREEGEREDLVVPTTMAELGRPAKRPARSVFDLSKYAGKVNTPRPWQDQYRAYRRERGRTA